jgi:hypothetical protein
MDESKNNTAPLFQKVLRAMVLAEKTGESGLTKHAMVLSMMLSAGLIVEADLPTVEGIIDVIIWSAHNAGDLAALAKRSGCLCCLSK